MIALQDILALCRISNLPTVWTNVLAAIVLSSAALSLADFLLLCLVLSCFYSAGMCLNDLVDSEEDRGDKAGSTDSGRADYKKNSTWVGCRPVTGTTVGPGFGLSAGCGCRFTFDRFHHSL